MKVKLRKILLCMSKLAIYALALTSSFTFALAANVEAQQQELSEIRINISEGQKSLLRSFAEIEGKSEFVFAYTSKDLRNKVVYLSKSYWRMDELLKEISSQTDLSFKRVNETITVRKIDEKENHPALIDKIIQTRTITGKVTSMEDDEGLPGVNVVEKGTTNGTVTDVQGEYSLEVSQGATLVFSSVGYTQEEVEVGNRSTIDLAMAQDIQQLQELVVVGYGAQKRSDLTGSVGIIDEEEIKKMPMTTLEQGMQGRVAGVQVTQADAAPGGVISVRIRGGNSISGNNEPLYVVDGFPTDDIRSINPNDIETMSILKDASATAIYGARGANGVVLITTKRGKQGDGQLSFEYYRGVQDITQKVPVLNLRQYAELTNEAYLQDGRSEPFPDVDVLVDSLNGGTNWQDEIFRTAPISNYQLSFSKGNENTQYAITANYFDQEGIVIGSNFKRYSFRINLNSNLSKKFRIGSNLFISRIDNDEVLVNNGGRGSAGVTHAALTSAPYLPVYDDNGDFFIDWQQEGPVFRRDNPVALALSVTNQNLTTRGLANFHAEYDIAEGLRAKVSVGTDLQFNKRNRYIPRTTYRAFFENGIASVFNNNTLNWLNENTLTYEKTFNQAHTINALIGATYQQQTSEFTSNSGSGFVNDILTFNDLSSAAVPNPSNTGANEWSLESYLARVNYIFNEKYFLTFSARIDGSSRFGANNKYGFFPSGAFKWKLSEEQFINNLNFFSDLNLRTSYGITGNQEIPLYRSQSALGSTNYIIGDALAIGIAPNRVANPDLRWEKTSQFDVGLDMAFINNRLRITSDFYYKKTSDLLLAVSIPWTSGFNTSLQNVGSVENKGFELGIDGDILTGDLSWTISANYSMNRDKVLDLGEVSEFFGPTSGFDSFYSPGPAIVVREGEPLNSFFGFVGDGIFRSQEEVDEGPDKGSRMEPGDIRFKDISGPEGVPDGLITPDDRTIIGNAMPDFIYGITNNFTWKNFDLNIFIQGVHGNQVLNAYRLYELESLRGTHNNSTRVLDRWSPDNPNGTMPKADRRGHERDVSTRGIEDATFFRLRNLVVGYNVPVENVGFLRSARVYFSGQNLLTITDYTGFDPEVNTFGQNVINQGIDYGAYPRAKTYMIGVNVGF